MYALDGPVQRLIWLFSIRSGISRTVLQVLYFAFVLGLGFLANRWIEDPTRHWFAALSRNAAVRRRSEAVSPVS